MLKQHILSEIQRTAAANAGVPLGRQRFLSETGIRETDWSGKHWARWSDALREAGFSPNELQSPFADEHLLEQYAYFAQQLGRVPTVAELKLRAREQSGFPSHNTFARFGNKQRLLDRVRRFALTKTELATVAVLLREFVVGDTSDAKEPSPLPEEAFGFVYLIKSGSHFKLGRTNALGRRERELAIQLPERSTTVHSIRTDDPQGIEAYWHRRFESKRKNGEWFELSALDVAAFRRRKFM